MVRFVGKLVVGGRLLDEAVGGSIQHEQPESARISGRVAISHEAEGLVREAAGPIHLIAEGGPTLLVELGESRVVGELYVVFEFVGEIAEADDLPVFSIRAYPDLRDRGRPSRVRTSRLDEDEDDEDAPVLLSFARIGAGRVRRPHSEVS